MAHSCTEFLARFSVAIALQVAQVAWAQDDTLDWVMGHATTAPATMPTVPAPRPLTRPSQLQGLSGTVKLSDGSTLAGRIATTPGKPLRIWVEQRHEYTDIPLENVRMIEATVLWERMEREWHFIASGSDVKEYTGRTYPARELQFTFTLRDGTKISGGTVAPLYVESGGGQHLVVLPKRQKGDIGTDLGRLLYPTVVEISERNTP